MPANETAFRSALAAMLGDKHQVLPADVRRDVQEHLDRRDAQGQTLCFAGPERDGLVTRVLAWADGKGREVGTALRKAIDMPVSPGSGRGPQGTPSHQRTTQMLSIDEVAAAVQEESPTVALYGATMTQLHIVLDELLVYAWATPEKAQKAFEACLEERVTATDTVDTYTVASRQTAEGSYRATVQGTCTCRYAETHPRERYGCYHPMAAKLYQRWQQNQRPLLAPPPVKETLMAQTLMPPPAEAPRMAQAPSSPREAPNTLTLPLRSITAIVADLSRPLPADCIGVLPPTQKRRESLSFLHWMTVARLLDAYAPGWSGSVVTLTQLDTVCGVTYRVSIPCAEGIVSREATGQEDGEVTGYGDSTSNAEAMAFKRAAAKFGVGLYLYDKDATAPALVAHLKHERGTALALLGKVLEEQGRDQAATIRWLRMQTGAGSRDEIPLAAIRALLTHLRAQGLAGAPSETQEVDAA
jgi:Rad52/22 family double-strand break repair protein